MLKSLLAISLVVFLSASLQAKEGQIGLFSDASGGNCNINDFPNEMMVYVVHVNHSDAGAVNFAVQSGLGFTGTFLSDTPVYPTTIGVSQSGVTIIYGSCETAPTHVLTITYMTFGTSQACSTIDVVADTNVPPPSPSMTGCTGGTLAVAGKSITVNPDDQCGCTVSTTPSTWGAIKAIYSVE